MEKPFVDAIDAPSGRVVVVQHNSGTIQLSDGRTLLRRFIGVPLLHQPLFGRDRDIATLRDKLCRQGGPIALSALDGLPGVGKTALAQAVACDAQVLEHFRGGVLWASLGPNADVDNVLDLWCTALGVESRDARDRARLLSLALQERTQGAPVLLVLDDVWNEAHLAPFREVAYPGCASLLTTRDAKIARRFAGQETVVRELDDAQAEAFLAAACPRAQEADPEGLRALAKAMGGLPLGLMLVAAALRDHAQQARWVRGAIQRLKTAEEQLLLAADEERPGLSGVPNTLRAIVELSVEALSPEMQEAFAALGAFAPKPVDFGREAAFAVWGMEEAQGDAVLQRLCDLSLVEVAGEDRFTVQGTSASLCSNMSKPYPSYGPSATEPTRSLRSTI